MIQPGVRGAGDIETERHEVWLMRSGSGTVIGRATAWLHLCLACPARTGERLAQEAGGAGSLDRVCAVIEPTRLQRSARTRSFHALARTGLATMDLTFRCAILRTCNRRSALAQHELCPDVAAGHA